jgi:hypothetical protein
MITAAVIAVLAILYVVQTPGIVGDAQEKTKQGSRTTGQVGDIVGAAVGGIVSALVGGIVGIAKSVFEAPQNRRQPSKSTKGR